MFSSPGGKNATVIQVSIIGYSITSSQFAILLKGAQEDHILLTSASILSPEKIGIPLKVNMKFQP